MTHTDAEAIIRAVARTCRGPCLVDAAVQQAAFDAMIGGADLSQLLEMLTATWQTFDEPLGRLPAFVESLRQSRSEWDTLIIALRARAGDVGLPGCGADINDLICAQAFDGQEHDYTCSRCGVTGTYRAPLFEGLDG